MGMDHDEGDANRVEQDEHDDVTEGQQLQQGDLGTDLEANDVMVHEEDGHPETAKERKQRLNKARQKACRARKRANETLDQAKQRKKTKRIENAIARGKVFLRP